MFDAYVTFQAGVRPHAPAIVTPNRIATYGELEDDVNRMAAGLRRLGVAPDRGIVSLNLSDPYLKHLAFLAMARLGVASSPAGDPAADLTLTDMQGVAEAGQIQLSPSWIQSTLQAEPYPVEPVRGPPDTVVRIMLSSGTTRTPRRVAKTWRSMESSAHTGVMTHLSVKSGRWVAFTGLDTMLGQNMALVAWATGATLVSGMDIPMLVRDLNALHPSIIGLTPVQLGGLLATLPERSVFQPQLRLVVSGSVLPPGLAREARLRLAPELWMSYGATESGTIAMVDGAMLETHPGVVGFAMPGVQVDVVDPDGAPVPNGTQGEIRVISERIAQGYIGNPQETATTFRHGGFYPGDIGRKLVGGLIVVDGRKDERMTIDGLKFLPNRVEVLALEVPGVRDAAAFAVPDGNNIDHCWLAVVQGDGLDRAVLAAKMAEPDHQLPPINFAWTEDIPRNERGKIDRNALRESTLAALGKALK